MEEFFRPYIEAIFKEREWSWAIIGIVYLLSASFIRGWFLNPLTRRAKNLERSFRGSVRKGYLKRSLLGWIFFLLPIGIIYLTWQREVQLPVDLKVESKILLLSLGAASFVLSVLSHLTAFNIASLETLRSTAEQQEKDKKKTEY